MVFSLFSKEKQQFKRLLLLALAYTNPSQTPMEMASPPIADPERTCSYCSKIAEKKLSICLCDSVRYCNRDCQKKDWPSHKVLCKEKCSKLNVGPSFSKIGVRASFLARIFSDKEAEGMSTDQVVLNLVLRDAVIKSKDGNVQYLSLAEKLRQDPFTAEHTQDIADSYVIHAWRYKWKDLVSSLNHPSLDPNRFLWIDAICVNQHEGLEEVVPEWWFRGAHDVIKSCKSVELVLLPWDNPIPVRRIWCVWEIIGAKSKSIDQFHVLVTTDERTRLETSLKEGKLMFETFQKVFSDVNIEKAEARNPEVYQRIIREVKKFGSIKINDIIMLPLKTWLETTINSIVMEDFSAVEKGNVLNGKGEFYHALGKLDQACKNFEESIEIRSRMNSPPSDATPEMNASLNNLAAVYMDMGKFDKAQRVLDRALKSCDKIYGTQGSTRNNSLVAMTLGNCALNYHHLGKLEKARTFYEEAIRVDESFHNSDPETAVRLNNFAKLLQDIGDLRSAKVHFELALPVLRKANGDDHPSVATLRNNLALLSCAMGNMEDAKEQFEAALSILQRTLGNGHPSVAGALNNLAAMYNSKGDSDTAVRYFQEALKIQRAALGGEHPDVATTLNNLASVKKSYGEYETAHELGKEALKIWTASTGPNSPQTKVARKLWGGELSPRIQQRKNSYLSSPVVSRSSLRRGSHSSSVSKSPAQFQRSIASLSISSTSPTKTAETRTSSGESPKTPLISKETRHRRRREVNSDEFDDDFDFQRMASLNG